MGKKFFEIILIVVVAVCLNLSAYTDNVNQLISSGRSLTAKQAEVLEGKLKKDPADVAARTELLGYYFVQSFRNQEARDAKSRHVLWLIKNAPDSKVLALPYGQLNKIMEAKAYEQAKVLWQEQIKKQPDNLKILDNSAKFFLLYDRKLAAASLEKACKIDPDNPEWHACFGYVYMLDMMQSPPDEKSKFATKSFEQFEIAYKLSKGAKAAVVMGPLAKMALAAGKLKEAKIYAEKMLADNPSDWNHGNNINTGNNILGIIALKAGDVDQARKYLEKAGNTSGSPQLNSFGPNMSLAKALLEKGEKDAVLKYFTQCAKFWKLGKNRLAKWTEEVKVGKIPNFGANLVY